MMKENCEKFSKFQKFLDVKCNKIFLLEFTEESSETQIPRPYDIHSNAYNIQFVNGFQKR